MVGWGRLAVLLTALALTLGATRAASAQEFTPAVRAKAKARIKKARAAYEAGNYDQAVVEYQAAYKIMPLPDILFNLGQILRVKEDKPEALKAYRKYVESEPDGSHAEEARGYVISLTREVLPEATRARYDEVKQAYEAFHDKNGDALDAKWNAVNAQIASGEPGLEAQLDALRDELRQRSLPAPTIDEAATRRALAKTTRTTPRDRTSTRPLLKKWWFWTAVGAALGSGDRDPTASLGVLK